MLGQQRLQFPRYPTQACRVIVLSQTTLDYRQQDDRLLAVARARRPLAPGVFQAWQAQESRRVQTPERAANLALLGRGEATVVVTGQQAGLFTGPLYTIYKTAAAITTARALSQETHTPVVPVFWLQTEDHDWPEIDHCYVPSTDGPTKVSVADALADGGLHGSGPAHAARVSVAQRRFGDAILQARSELAAHLGSLPSAAEVMELVETHYAPDAAPGEALGGLMATLFGSHGLLVLDPRDPELAVAAAQVHRTAFEEAAPIANALLARCQVLADQGRPTPVHIRPGAPLSFYHPEGADGPRFRLAAGDGSGVSGDAVWSICGEVETSESGGSSVGSSGTVTADEVAQALQQSPGCLSTSALLRPILQDVWLPTAAYVGGPGEIAYLAQITPLYAFFGRQEPLIIPRARFQVLDRHTERRLTALGLTTADDLTQSRESLLARVGQSGEGHDDVLAPEALEAEWTATVDGMFEPFQAATNGLDTGLQKATVRARQSVHKELTRLLGRYARTLVQQDEAAVARLDRIVAMLAPLGAPQERIYGWPWYAARYGIEAFTTTVLTACRPFDGTLKDIDPEQSAGDQ